MSGAAERERDHMSVAELRELEEVRGLITRGQQVGVLTSADIETATAELGLDETDVEELHGLFERSEIELVEEIDPATAGLNTEPAPEKRTGGRAPLDLQPEGTTDALQLFLKDIGGVRLFRLGSHSSPSLLYEPSEQRKSCRRPVHLQLMLASR